MSSETKTTSSIKTLVVVTYIIATVLLVAGWFVPIFDSANADLEIVDKMMFWYVPAFINAFLFPFTGGNLIEGDIVSRHNLGDYAKFTAEIVPGTEFDLTALMVLIYLVITVAAIICLIPVLVSKKDKVCLKTAYAVEGAALAALGLTFLSACWSAAYGITGGSSENMPVIVDGFMNVLAVFAAVLVIVFIQSIAEKKAYGAVKVVLFLLSLATFIFAMFAIDIFIQNALGDTWYDFLDTIMATSGLIGIGGLDYTVALVYNPEMIFAEGTPITASILYICVLAFAIVALVNLIIDLYGMMANNQRGENGALLKHKGGKIFGIVRYALALVLLIAIIVLCFVEENIGVVGICTYAATLFALISLILAISRLAYNKKIEAKNSQSKDITLVSDVAEDSEETSDFVTDEEPAVAPYPVYAEEAPAEPVPAEVVEEPVTAFDEQLEITEVPEEAKPEEEEPRPEPYVYTPAPVIYNGPTDEFLDSLSTEEKIEFCKVFIDKTKGTLPKKMPEYQIGGDNADFFPAIFINLGRFRALLSSGLLRKIYKYLNTK